jgi:hypothetical protein
VYNKKSGELMRKMLFLVWICVKCVLFQHKATLEIKFSKCFVFREAFYAYRDNVRNMLFISKSCGTT